MSKSMPMQIQPGDVLQTISAQGTVIEWLYCGKLDIDSSANRLFYNITTHKRIGVKYGCYFRMSKWSLEEFGARSIKKVKNVGKEKAVKLKNKYEQLKSQEANNVRSKK